jgi:hypothetical protein
MVNDVYTNTKNDTIPENVITKPIVASKRNVGAESHANGVHGLSCCAGPDSHVGQLPVVWFRVIFYADFMTF